jgi:hypothetical protein
MGAPELAVPYKLTYIGLREARVNHDQVRDYIQTNSGGGWLIDATESNHDGIYNVLSWTGRYKRLMFDGSVQNRTYQKVDCNGPDGHVEPCTTQMLLFTDPDDKIRKWILSTS